MAQIVPPKPQAINSTDLLDWHAIFKPPWDVLIGIGYVEGVDVRLTGASVDGLTVAAGEVTADNADQTLAERELDDTDGELCFLISDNAADTFNVRVRGVNSANDREELVFTLNGTTPVPLTNAEVDNKWKSVCLVANISSANNVGTVYTSTNAVGVPTNVDKIQTLMGVGANLSLNPLIMVANEEVFVFPGIDTSADTKDEIVLRLARKMTPGGTFFKVFKWFVFDNGDHFRFTVPVALTAGQKVAVTVQATSVNTDLAWQMSYYSLTAANLDPQRAGSGKLYE